MDGYVVHIEELETTLDSGSKMVKDVRWVEKKCRTVVELCDGFNFDGLLKFTLVFTSLCPQS